MRHSSSDRGARSSSRRRRISGPISTSRRDSPELLGDRASLRLVDRSRLETALDDDVAVLMLTHVDFRTGEMHDMEAMDPRRPTMRERSSCGILLIQPGPCRSTSRAVRRISPSAAATSTSTAARVHPPLPSLPDGITTSCNHRCGGGWATEAPFDFDTEYRPARGSRRAPGRNTTDPQPRGARVWCRGIAEIGVDALRAKSDGADRALHRPCRAGVRRSSASSSRRRATLNVAAVRCRSAIRRATRSCRR